MRGRTLFTQVRRVLNLTIWCPCRASHLSHRLLHKSFLSRSAHHVTSGTCNCSRHLQWFAPVRPSISHCASPGSSFRHRGFEMRYFLMFPVHLHGHLRSLLDHLLPSILLALAATIDVLVEVASPFSDHDPWLSTSVSHASSRCRQRVGPRSTCSWKRRTPTSEATSVSSSRHPLCRCLEAHLPTSVLRWFLLAVSMLPVEER